MFKLTIQLFSLDISHSSRGPQATAFPCQKNVLAYILFLPRNFIEEKPLTSYWHFVFLLPAIPSYYNWKLLQPLPLSHWSYRAAPETVWAPSLAPVVKRRGHKAVTGTICPLRFPFLKVHMNIWLPFILGFWDVPLPRGGQKQLGDLAGSFTGRWHLR